MMRFTLQSLRGWQRNRRVTELLAVLWVIALFDLVLTLWAHFFTEFRELNPLANRLLGGGHYAGLVLFKLITTGVGTLVLYKIRHTRLGEIATWAIVIVYFSLAIHWGGYTSDTLTNHASLQTYWPPDSDMVSQIDRD